MPVTVSFGAFEWDKDKETLNINVHGLDFYAAALAFLDSNRIVAIDGLHSQQEPRFFCIGKIGETNRYGSIYQAWQAHPNHRSRLLAQRAETL